MKRVWRVCIVVLFLLVNTACSNTKEMTAPINNKEKNQNHHNHLVYEIISKKSSSVIGSHEIFMEEKNKKYIIKEVRSLKKEFLVGLGKDLKNEKEYELDAQKSLTKSAEKEYLDGKLRLVSNTDVSIEDQAKKVNAKVTEYLDDGKENTTSKLVVLPEKENISINSYFQNLYLIPNIIEKYTYFTSTDGQIFSMSNIGKEEINVPKIGLIEATVLSVSNTKTKLWLDTERNIILRIEDILNESTSIITQLKELE